MNWKTHTHKPGDTKQSQHGPNLHTHGLNGKVDTIMGEPRGDDMEHTKEYAHGAAADWCGCRLALDCPLHAAAPALLDVAEMLIAMQDKGEFEIGDCIMRARAAIQQAKGD